MKIKETTVQCFYCEKDMKVNKEECPKDPRWVCPECYEKWNKLHEGK